MLTFQLDPETEGRLVRLARAAGLSTDFYVSEVIFQHVEEMEEGLHQPGRRMRRPERSYSAEAVKRHLGL